MVKYCAVRDLDGDGQDELLLFSMDGVLCKVAGIQNGTVHEILTGDMMFLCEGNVLENSDDSGATVYYQVENNTAVPIERIVYSISTFQSYRDRSLGLGEEVLTPITEEERLQVKDTYPRMTMGMCNPKFLETISL